MTAINYVVNWLHSPADLSWGSIIFGNLVGIIIVIIVKDLQRSKQ